jgi:hypothetical protein
VWLDWGRVKRHTGPKVQKGKKGRARRFWGTVHVDDNRNPKSKVKRRKHVILKIAPSKDNRISFSTQALKVKTPRLDAIWFQIFTW